MTTLEKLETVLAYRYAKRQKFKTDLETIKYGKSGKRKMPTGKKLTIFLIANLTLVEVYTLFIMYYLRDISALPVLITAVVGDVIALLIYQIKSLKENTADTGFMYELKMREANNNTNCNTNDDNAVG